ncbi:regulatory protein RecX [Algoriphagus namhaensis]|uniref:Regulatory protein RecX n=1 Tax=Algoriphagus namhaensis TaxID=915353 RepID=A0ABV8ARZ2_9BACT
MWRKESSSNRTKKSWNSTELQEKMMAFCAYQERCVWDAKRKMQEREVAEEDQEQVLEYLIQEKFIDEERYVRAFARGKFNFKKWGKNRIRMELKMRQIPESLIKIGLAEIDPFAYYDTLCNQVELRWQKEKEQDPYKKKYKVSQYLMSKGYEYDLIREAIDDSFQT